MDHNSIVIILYGAQVVLVHTFVRVELGAFEQKRAKSCKIGGPEEEFWIGARPVRPPVLPYALYVSDVSRAPGLHM